MGSMDSEDACWLDGLLKNAAAAQRLRLERALRPCELSPAQFEAMRHVNKRENLSGAELARVCALSPQTIGVVVENLEKKALVRRSADSSNPRIQRICLTDGGVSVLKRAVVCAAKAVGPPIVDAMRGEDRAGVVRILTKLARGER